MTSVRQLSLRPAVGGAFPLVRSDPRRVSAGEARVEDGQEPAEHDAEEEVHEEVLAGDDEVDRRLLPGRA